MCSFVAKTPRPAALAPDGAIGSRLGDQTLLGRVALRLPAGMTRRPAVVVLISVPGGRRHSVRSPLLNRFSVACEGSQRAGGFVCASAAHRSAPATSINAAPASKKAFILAISTAPDFPPLTVY